MRPKIERSEWRNIRQNFGKRVKTFRKKHSFHFLLLQQNCLDYALILWYTLHNSERAKRGAVNSAFLGCLFLNKMYLAYQNVVVPIGLKNIIECKHRCIVLLQLKFVTNEGMWRISIYRQICSFEYVRVRRICRCFSSLILWKGYLKKRNQFAVVTDGHRRTQVGARGARSPPPWDPQNQGFCPEIKDFAILLAILFRDASRREQIHF